MVSNCSNQATFILRLNIWIITWSDGDQASLINYAGGNATHYQISAVFHAPQITIINIL